MTDGFRLVRPCACGSPVIVTNPAIMPDVAAHNHGEAHQDWRARGGMGFAYRPESAGEVIARAFASQEAHGIEPPAWRYEHGHRVPIG